MKKTRLHIIAMFTAAVFGLLIAAGLTSCQKDGNASPTGLNTQINILNLSPDVLYLEFWVKQVRQANKLYRYPTPSNYFYLNSLTDQLQIRRERQSGTVFDTIPQQALSTNTRYSLFIYGLQTNNTWRHIFLPDTGALPAAGRGKVRFVNAVSRAATVDVTANGTTAFTNRAMGSISKYVEMPAGIYSFKFLTSGSTSVINTLPNVTVQDGRLYTIYTYGIVGRTDSAQIGSNFMTVR